MKTEEDEVKKFYAKNKQLMENIVAKCNTEENYNSKKNNNNSNNINNNNAKMSASLISKFGQFSAMFKSLLIFYFVIMEIESQSG